MPVKCKFCEKEFETADSMEQHAKVKHESGNASGISRNKKPRKYLIITALIIAVLAFSSAIYIKSQKPSSYDEFAKCLSDKGAIVYGNDFCQYTAKQLNWFGKSEQYLTYVKCIDNKELCDRKGVKTTPTWEINGKMYEGVQSFEKLSEISGCPV